MAIEEKNLLPEVRTAGSAWRHKFDADVAELAAWDNLPQRHKDALIRGDRLFQKAMARFDPSPRLDGELRDDINPGDASHDILHRARLGINFYHIASNTDVWFKAFLTDFRDDYQSEWSSEAVYGRMDPIETFQGTKRVITLGWDMVAYDVVEAKYNMYDIDSLISMLYPVYDTVDGGAGSIVASPLLKLKFANLITQPSAKPGLTNALEEGLVGRVGGISYTPKIEHGFFTDADEDVPAGATDRDAGEGNPPGGLWPQVVSLSCDFTVFHTHKLGWRKKDKKLVRQEGFPHGAGGSSRAPLPDMSYHKMANLQTPSTPGQKAVAAGILTSGNLEIGSALGDAGVPGAGASFAELTTSAADMLTASDVDL